MSNNGPEALVSKDHPDNGPQPEDVYADTTGEPISDVFVEVPDITPDDSQPPS